MFLRVLHVPRDREERMAALSAAQQEAMEELQKKIQMKVSSLNPTLTVAYWTTVCTVRPLL